MIHKKLSTYVTLLVSFLFLSGCRNKRPEIIQEKFPDEIRAQEMKDLRLYELFAGTSENAPPVRTVKEGDR